MKSDEKQKGISLFIAVLVASVAALFSFAISNIALREVILAQTGRDSQLSFYAANSGIECALFWDLKKGSFEPGKISEINCNDQTKTVDMRLSTDDGTTYVFNLPINNAISLGDSSNDSCFVFTMTKKINFDDDNEGEIESIDTTLVSRGYNTCDFNSARVLERAIRVTY